MNCVQAFNQRQMEKLEQMRSKPFPKFGPGDTVSVHLKIREGEKERIQRFEGLCIGMRNAGVHSSFRVRRVSGEYALERVFKIYSPLIDHIDCLRRGKVRRAKLYYIRALSQKKARIKERTRAVS